ncbi:hypothetical protein SAMN05444410_11241 [Hydrobacter penzbergensis]|uniref:Uncharacterized protein n=1 Tax=Hydrobacter penzbergensis TaxID=1235997 RepID=A0A8X8IE40_9BACT|nr:hypothetical protein SAMN05444410_11241 [Hydrobacter penzbergensis]
MKKPKMGLDSLKGKMSRAEMKNIMAGTTAYCRVNLPCTLYANGITYSGNCDAGFGGGSGGYMECGCSTQYGVYTPTSGTSHCVQ